MFNVFGIDFLHGHASALDIRRVLGERLYSEYFKFAVVRNPWDIEVSRYLFAKKQITHKLHKLANTMNFVDFLRWKLERDMGSRQYIKVCDKEGRLIVNRVIRNENLSHEIPGLINSLFGVEVRVVPRLNATRMAANYSQYYNIEARDIVSRLNRIDIEKFEYKFQE